MKSKVSRYILKYFYFTVMNLSVIFSMKCDFQNLTVQKSYYRSITLLFWSSFFFFVSYKEWNEASSAELQKDGQVFLNTKIIEFAAEATAIILVTIMQFRNSKLNRAFVKLLMKVYEKTSISYDLFEDSIGYHITIVAIISELGLWFLVAKNLIQGVQIGRSFLPLDFSENVIGRSLIASFPYEMMTRFCIVLAFAIDYTRKVVKKLNVSLEQSLERISITKDSEDCCSVIQQTDQWITMIMRIIKRYEKNFAFIILVFQCIAFISGVSQVCAQKLRLKKCHEQLFSFADVLLV